MNTLSNIKEGFFRNTGISCVPLVDFLNAYQNNIINLKGKDYLVHNGLIYDVQDLKNTVYTMLDPDKLRANKNLTNPNAKKAFNEITFVGFADGARSNRIVIQYIFHSLANVVNNTRPPIRNSYMFDSICGSQMKDEYLIKFLKDISK